MMHLDKDKRASTELLMAHPEVSLRVRNAHIKDIDQNCKKKEEDILKRE